jgi:hypothetical protein
MADKLNFLLALAQPLWRRGIGMTGGLELFARRRVAGWDARGDEVEGG